MDLTALLRNDKGPFFQRIRSLLGARGVDPATTLLADLFPDDGAFEFGLVVTVDRRVFQFGYDYMHRDVGAGEFTEWVERTDNWETSSYAKEVGATFALLDTGAGPPPAG